MTFDELENAFRLVSSRASLKKNEHLVREGEAARTLAYIESGYMRSYQVDYQGNDITTNLYTPQGFCGSYYGFYLQTPSLESLVALTDVELQLITYDDLMALYEDHVEANRFGRRMIEQVCLEKDIRISKMLKLDAQARYEWFAQTYPHFILHVPMKHIATYLGMSRETISRIRKKVI